MKRRVWRQKRILEKELEVVVEELKKTRGLNIGVFGGERFAKF